MIILKESIGYIRESVAALPNAIERLKPSEFAEKKRYLPESVSSLPGNIRYSNTPYMREIVDCFDIHSPVREIAVKKAAQIGATTGILESALFYFMGHVRTLPIMLVTADRELASTRIENNVLPMLQQSQMGHIIQSSDAGNRRKTGKTKNHIQFEGGGVLYPQGANSANKMRQFSIAVMLKDELDGWPQTVGRDGDPDALTDGRCRGFWNSRKIAFISTPNIKGQSKIDKRFKRGDQRVYRVLCRNCNAPQQIRWEVIDKETGEILGGIQWDYNSDGTLAVDSVRYVCIECQHEHFEHDKEWLLAEENGAHWFPTATPVGEGIRSYQIPAMLAPSSLAKWESSVQAFLDAFDVKERKVKDYESFRTFYNNHLGESFAKKAIRLSFRAVSGHRRVVYRRGEIPNHYAVKHSGSRVLVLTMTVDVHDANLAVAVFGWCVDGRCYLIDYWRLKPRKDEGVNCTSADCSVWGELQELIEKKRYVADDGSQYGIATTFIDSGYQNALVSSFCAQYQRGVHAIVGRKGPSKYQRQKEFDVFTTQAGVDGFRISVDYYKDRWGPVLRSAWDERSGDKQPTNCFNVPVDIRDAELTELTVEKRMEKTDPNTGESVWYWNRPSGKDNELWDLLMYANAAIEVQAWAICTKVYDMETVDWLRYWRYIEDYRVFYTLPKPAEGGKDNGK